MALLVLPNELLFKIFGLVDKKDLKRLNILCHRIHNVVQFLLFRELKLKKRMSCEQLLDYPIIILDTSNLLDVRLTQFPKTVNHVYFPHPYPKISPDIIKAHEEINFYFTVLSLTSQEYHMSHYELPNLKLLTSGRCYITFQNYLKYSNFIFHKVSWSHFTALDDQIIIILQTLKIDQINLDWSVNPKKIEDLIQFQNITRISTKVINHFKNRHKSNILSLRLFKPFKNLKQIEFHIKDQILFTDYLLMRAPLKHIVISDKNTAKICTPFTYKVNWSHLRH